MRSALGRLQEAVTRPPDATTRPPDAASRPPDATTRPPDAGNCRQNGFASRPNFGQRYLIPLSSHFEQGSGEPWASNRLFT